MTNDWGTVLKIHSHRARSRLDRVLGRPPAEYFAIELGNGFVILYGGDVGKALEIPGVRRTRVAADRLSLCWATGYNPRARRCADLWDGAQR